MVAWSEALDEILGADHTVMLTYVTPASGVVLLPVNNFALRDRGAGTISAVNSSVGAWRKLERIRRNPKLALAYHTRLHSDTGRTEYVLVQGRASLSSPISDYPASLGERWERFESWSRTPAPWKRWLRVYARRIEVEIAVERVVAWPDLFCAGEPLVHGPPLLERPPDSQRPPAKGTGPRLDAARAAAQAARLPHVLLGWVEADGYPAAAPVEVLGGDQDGISLRAAPGLVPPGRRRAGLTAHWFSHGALGQNQRKHTGWLEASSDGELLYAPHTQSNYRFPASPTLYRFFVGGATRWGARGAREARFGQ